MRAVTKKNAEETRPKLPFQGIDTHIEQGNMKFNWKANWEILLVLVIIIVGIVITTIAAIRSKDKQLLVLPDDASDYGEGGGLSGGSGGVNIVDQASSLQVPPLPQTDFQLIQNVHQPRNPGEEGDDGVTSSSLAATAQASSASTRGPTKSLSSAPTQPGHQVHATTRKDFVSANRQQPSSSKQLPNRVTAPGKNRHDELAGVDYNDLQSQMDRNLHLPVGNYNRPQHRGSNSVQSNNTSDNYDTSSTEPTPSLRSNKTRAVQSSRALNIRRNVTSKHTPKTVQHEGKSLGSLTDLTKLDGNDQTGESADDIHTTKSSLAQVGDSTAVEQAQNLQHLMHGPYDISQTVLNQHHHNQMEQLTNRLNHQKLLQQTNNTDGVNPALESDDMMTSYTRLPQKNLTEAALRDYNLTGATYRGNGNSFAQPIDSLEQQQSFADATPSRSRLNSASLPFSMLLNDLVRLARPSQSGTISTPAELEQPANSRQQFSILQQLRSLPAPILALLQGSSAMNGAGDHSGASNGQLSSNDASESSQHYQRISMSPSEFLSRSLRTTGTLPAFPPPKGTPQIWIPPTSGGNPAVNDFANNNADFIATNTAGFLRASEASQVRSSNEGSQVQSSNAQAHQPAPDMSLYNQQQAQVQPQSHQGQSSDLSNHPLPDGSQQQLSQTGQSPSPLVQTQISPQNRPLTKSFDYQQLPSPLVGNYISNIQQHHSIAPMNGNALAGSLPSLYNSRQTNSETIESKPVVPSGYNQINILQQQQQQQFMGPNTYQPQQVSLSKDTNALYDSNVMPIESAPKASLVPVAHSRHQQQTSNFNRPSQKHQQQLQLTDLSQRSTISGPPSQPLQLNTINRQKRELKGIAKGEDDEEEYLDSRPLSIVSPDGRPMSSDDVKILRAGQLANARKFRGANGDLPESSSSQRQINHMDLDESALHHYVTSESSKINQKPSARKTVSVHRKRKNDSVTASGDRPADKAGKNLKIDSTKSTGKTRVGQPELEIPRSTGDKKRRKVAGKNSKEALKLHTASSRLLNLLGTASTNDELEDDIDSDDDENSANERRKEELDDAEFGIVNDDHSSGPQAGGGDDVNSNVDPRSSITQNEEVNRLIPDRPNHNGNDDSSLGSGSVDSNAYTRRNQQQPSDVEFYGHPGEETRQLKYGILGSGNYEVVNGGIYPDIDESTAAVNSVANYIRKPGNVLLAGLPKLLAAAGASRAENSQAGFMPGARMSAVNSGFMRGASANPDELVGMFAPPSTSSGNLGLTNPLLELIDASNGNLIDPNLMAQLGSSGTSARSTHTSKDGEGDKSQDNSSSQDREEEHGHESIQAVRKPRNRAKTRAQQADANKRRQAESMAHMMEVERDGDMKIVNGADQTNEGDNSYSADNQVHRPPLSGSKGQGANQFYSYQISPSKKVTIFSDQDLDSEQSNVDRRTSSFLSPPSD